MLAYRRSTSGFTLIELMIVVIVVGILMAIGLPAYQDQVRKSKRAVGKGELQSLLSRQEQFFVNNRQYATDLQNLGFGAAAAYSINSDGDEVAAAAGDRIYNITISGASATAFTLQAVPQLQQAKDTLCATLQVTSTGVKTSSTGSTECW